MSMKNMKTLSFLRNLSKFFLVASALTLGCMPAFSEVTMVRSDGGWNGKVTKLDIIGDYYQFTLDKFRGEIVIETDIEADTIYLPGNNTKGWVLENDKAVKVQINNETSGFLCVSYDRPTNSVSVAYGSCSGTIHADKDRVCKTTGGDVKFKVENGDASASKRWGLLSYDGKDTTWLSTYNDRDSFVYTVTDSIVMLLKYTTSSGLVSYSSAKVGLSLADCGYKVTSSVTNICPGDPVVLTSNYTEGTNYEWRRNNGKVLATTNVPTLSLNPLNSSKYKLYVDGLFAGETEVKVSGCGFYISSFYPTDMCMQDSNSLVAIGEDMLPDLGKNVFEWQTSEDGVLWTTIKTNTSNRLNVFPTEDRYYRAVYKGVYTSPFFYEAPNCEDAGDCRGLQTRTLFYESFGYFIDEHTYVSDKEVFVNDMTLKGGVAGIVNGNTVGYAGNHSSDQSGQDYMRRIAYHNNNSPYNNGSGFYSVREDQNGSLRVSQTDGTTTFHIQKYIAPDPNGYVVPATQFVHLPGSDGRPSTSNHFVGTDGHLFMQANPLLPEYNWTEYEGRNKAFRLQDGYYAIVANPDSVDHHDGNSYVDCTDNTGNVNGAMLFVNCGETSRSKAAIYAQRVHLGCPADRFAFSMAVKNATAKEFTSEGEPQNPINVSVYLLKDEGSDVLPDAYRTMGSVPAESILNNDIESGNIPAGSDEWHEVDQYVQLDPSQKVQSLWVVLYNNGPSGNGNDLLLDDISFSVCLPKAELSAKVDGELITGALTVCDGRDVELVAKQKGDYIQNPVYLFQYFDKDTQSWEDMKDYSDDSNYKKTNAIVSVTDPRFVGDIQYRVIIGSSVDELRDVELHSGDVCNEFLVATSDIDIKNTFGGPMCADNDEEKICFVVGDTITVRGCRNLTRKDHTWKMFWKSEEHDAILVDTMEVTGVDADSIRFIVDKNYTVHVYDRTWKELPTTDSVGMSKIIFGAVDEGGCEHQQKFTLVAKHVVNLNYNVESTHGCDSVLVQVYKDVPEAGLRWDWGRPGREVIINDTARVFYPEGLEKNATIEGVLKVSVINDGDQFCAPAEPMEVPYKVYNVSYSLTVVPSANPICVTPGQDDDEVLMDVNVLVDPSAAASNITAYHWRMDFGNGDVVDTVSTTSYIELRHRDLKNRTGRSAKIDIIYTETVECGDIENNNASSAAEIEIREGAFKLTVEPTNSKVCLSSVDSIVLKVSVNPKEALTNFNHISLLQSRDSFYSINTNVTDSVYEVVLRKADYPNFFKPGTSLYFSASAYDEYCGANSVSPSVRVDLNSIDPTYLLDANEPTACLTYGEKLTLTATLPDPNAAKLIKSYKWYRDGEFVGGSGLSHSFVVGESSNSNYKLVISDEICDDVADSIDVAVSIKYKTTLIASKLTTCQESDSATVHVNFSPATSILQVKQFEWHAVVNGVDTVMYTGNHADSVLVINSERFPWLVRAGVNAKIYLITRDNICEDVRSDGDLDFRFNSPYTMLVDYNGKSVCVPHDEANMDPDTVLLRVAVTIEPAEALGQVKNYIWHIKSGDETLWNVSTTDVNHLELTYNDLKRYTGKDIEVYVSSYDDICAQGVDPNVSDTVKVQIRVGGFEIELGDLPEAYCVESLDSASFVLKAVIKPANARNNISKFYWYDNGVIIATTDEDSVVLDKNNYPKAFSAGYTANFSVAAYDKHCELDVVKSNKSTEVRFNTKFELTLSIPSHKICMPATEEEVTLIAYTVPEDAQKHIKEYMWERTSPSNLSTTTTVNKLNLEEAKWLAVAERMYFTVTAYDDVCYNKANGGAGKEDSFMVNQNYKPIMTLDDHYLCSKDDRAKSTVVIDPADAYYTDYSFHYVYKGKTYDLASRELKENIFYSSDFPENMSPGDVLDLYVIVDDGGVCGPVESDRSANLYVQTPYELKLDVDKNKACVVGDVTFNVSAITPEGSERFIKEYVWYDGSRAIDGVSKLQKSYTTKSFDVGTHEITVVSVDSICPNVTSNAQTLEVFDSLRVTLTPSTYTYCSPNDGDIKLVAQVTTGTPARYELYDAVSNELLKVVRHTYKNCTFEGYNPTVDHNIFTVRVFDEVCSYDDATAGVASSSINVHVPVNFEIKIKDDVKDVCVGDTINLSLIPISGFPTYYNIYGKSSELVQRVVAHDTTQFFDVAQKGGYLNYTIVAVDEICPNSSESNGSVFVHESPVVQLYANKENVIIGGDIELYADPEVGSPTTYEWFCDGRSFDVTSVNRTTYLPESTSEYSVVASDGVCPSATSSIVLEVKLPTAFTPYVVDDFNDSFMRGFTLMVFDRYGQKVFEGDNGWYGHKGDTDEFVDPGVYFYKVVMKNGRVEKGTVEVVLDK